ncbi:MAG: hypothetical protein AW06_004221 [Candidatus Accumulibacter cognatus]|uniref:Uncharacterized protein n=1 Tax=Candidatus Accumulibacter cognatus TaxID=2954383 RepID=A0A080MCA7_9PROT|nr:MAG: hypothetical protein AW06_004221 [Candidatus Accumulibacter cognatus]
MQASPSCQSRPFPPQPGQTRGGPPGPVGVGVFAEVDEAVFDQHVQKSGETDTGVALGQFEVVQRGSVRRLHDPFQDRNHQLSLTILVDLAVELESLVELVIEIVVQNRAHVVGKHPGEVSWWRR